MLKNKLSIRKRLFLYIAITVVALFISMGVITYLFVFRLIMNQTKTNGKNIAISAASAIDGDMIELIDSDECDEYQIIYDALSKYYVFESVEYIYTMMLDDGTLRFVVDADPANPAEFMEEYPMINDILPAFNGIACSDKTFTRDEWGVMLSSYAPVFNTKGDVVCVVGVDAEIGQLNAYRLALIRIVLSIALVFGAVAIALYIHISNDYMSRDGLTELYTQDSLEAIARKNYVKNNSFYKYTVVMLNIQDFSLINNRYGYGTGDKILIYVANSIKMLIKNNGIASRTSSDNYAIIIRNALVSDFLDKITSLKYNFVGVNGAEEINIPVCCGVYAVREGDTVSDVISRTLVALRNARRSGNPDIVNFTSEMYETAVYERQILADFSDAILNEEFVVYLQPKVDITKNRLCGAEALVRWIKDGRMIPPGMFVPVYEREGRITDLDFYVYEKVCQMLKNWKDLGYELFPVSANFSKVHLIKEDFADRIIELVDRYGIDHEYIDIELTESTGYSDRNALDTFIRKIRAAGIRTSMDDFGSGYASLELLDSSLFDTVKVDKTLTDKINQSEEGSNFVKNIVKTITDINCDAVCEGVETAEQVEFLRNETSCIIAQGYYFDRPLPLEEYEKRLLEPYYPGFHK